MKDKRIIICIMLLAEVYKRMLEIWYDKSDPESLHFYDGQMDFRISPGRGTYSANLLNVI